MYGDQEFGEFVVDFGDVEIVCMFVEEMQLGCVDGEDGVVGGIVECQYGIQVVFVYVVDGKGYLLFCLGVEEGVLFVWGGQGGVLCYVGVVFYICMG